MATVFVGVGSNIDPETNIPAALRLLGQQVNITGISTFYRTDPIGPPGSPEYYNGVFRIETDTDPLALKHSVLNAIEDALGRVRNEDKCYPRTIDLDILLCDSVVLQLPDLTLPDPHITSRPFVAVPLAELAPDMVLPGDGRTLREIARSLAERSIKPLESFTNTLRKELEDEPRESPRAGQATAD